MKDTKSLRQCWLGFWHGATRPSLTALVIAFSLNVTAFAAFVLFVTPDFMRGPGHRFLMIHDLDSQAHVTSKALAIQYSEAPVVVVLGASVTKICVANDERLTDLIKDELGETPLVYNMTTDAQTTWEMAALVDRLPSGFNGVFVLGLSSGLLSHGITDGPGNGYTSLAAILDHPKLGFASEALDSEARLAGLKVPYRTGVYALDNLDFFLARRYRIALNLLKGAPTYGDPLNAPWIPKVNRQEFWEQEIAGLPKQIKYYEANSHANLTTIGRFVAKLKTRGDAVFILLEPPVNPRWYNERTGAEFFKKYHNDLRRYAAEHNMSFLPITEEAALLPTDFVDYEGHIGTPGARDRCTKTLASRVSGILTARRAQPRQY